VHGSALPPYLEYPGVGLCHISVNLSPNGEKNNGFDVLYHNMKYGQIASKNLMEFFRERASIEETHYKLITKLTKQAGPCNNGSFAPLWQVLKTSSEKLSSCYLQIVQRYQDLVKDVIKYCEEQHKKHKSVKDEEALTSEIVQTLQTTLANLTKTKETYNQRHIEYEKLKRENATIKEVEKAETRFKKSCEEYKSLVAKYANVKDQYEAKMTQSCKNFQVVEEAHLRQMKLFLENYADVLETGHSLIGQAYFEFRQQCTQMTVDHLLELFTQTKGTGSDRPGPIIFEEADGLSILTSTTLGQDLLEKETNGEKMTVKKEGFFRTSPRTRPISPPPPTIINVSEVDSPASADLSGHAADNGDVTPTDPNRSAFHSSKCKIPDKY